jgi:multidrug efflux system outer membrane protein
MAGGPAENTMTAAAMIGPVAFGLMTRSAMLLLLLLGGCNLGPDYQRPDVEMPAEFRATPASEAAAWPSDEWWRGFSSHELNTLIEQAREQNLDIAAAIARVRQADAQVRIAGAPLLPTVAATGNASWQQVGATKGFSGVTRGGSTTSTINVHNYSLTP